MSKQKAKMEKETRKLKEEKRPTEEELRMRNKDRKSEKRCIKRKTLLAIIEAQPPQIQASVRQGFKVQITFAFGVTVHL
jgi:hypothetical protein